MSQKSITPDEAKEAAREYIKLTQTNTVNLAGTVVSKNESEPKAKMKDGVHLMENGAPAYYAPRRSCKVAFIGGEVEVPLTFEQYEKIQETSIYLFKGRLGLVKNFGTESVSYIFSTIEEL